MQIDVKEHPTMPGVFVTRDGRVFVELTASPSSGGYHTVKVHGEAGNGRTIRRHTLVAETYLGPRPFLRAEVRHRDGKAWHDHADNLLWGTRQENAQDAVWHGTTTSGERNVNAHLTEDQATEIKERRSAGESGVSLAREFGVSEQTVCDIHKGRGWRHLGRGRQDRIEPIIA